MNKILLVTIPLLVLGIIFFTINFFKSQEIISGAPPYHLGGEPPSNLDEYSYLKDWKRPDGPPKVGLQVGHYKNEEVPDELHRLRGSTGATGGGKSEWEVNFAIAEIAKQILEKEGIVVEILPATVPVDFWADVFVSIHADGNMDTSKTGFKLAAPRRDLSGKAKNLISEIEKTYGVATGLSIDPNVTRNMRGYYAFAWWRYDHAVHPMTTSVILETGFLTSPSDQEILIGYPELSAKGLASGIINFLRSENLLSNS